MKPDALRGVLNVAEASEIVRTGAPVTPEQRQHILNTVVRADEAGACLARFMTLPDQQQHDLRLALADLADANGWTIPDDWAEEDPCLR